MADDFGAHLKHERELRGVSLDEIATTTKIHLKYLHALEENQFDELPGEVFIKGFIRSYGKAIGANVEELLTHYDETVGEVRKNTVSGQALPGQEETHRQTNITNAMVGGFLGLFLLFAIWYLVQTPPPKPDSQELQERPPASAPLVRDNAETGEKEVSAENVEVLETPPGEEVTSPEEKKPLTEETQPNDPPATEVPKKPEEEKAVTERQNGGTIQTLQGQQVQVDAENSSKPDSAAPLDLQIRVAENAWFNVTLDDAGEKDFILPAGSTKRFGAKKEMRLTIGNRRATTLKLNGKSLDLPPSADNVVRDFKVNLNSIK